MAPACPLCLAPLQPLLGGGRLRRLDMGPWRGRCGKVLPQSSRRVDAAAGAWLHRWPGAERATLRVVARAGSIDFRLSMASRLPCLACPKPALCHATAPPLHIAA